MFGQAAPATGPADSQAQGASTQVSEGQPPDKPQPAVAAAVATEPPPACTTEAPAAVLSAPVYGGLTALIPEGRSVEVEAKAVCAEAVWYSVAENGWISAEYLHCDDIDIAEAECPGGAALAAQKANRCIVVTDANSRFGPSAEYDAASQLSLGGEVTVIGEYAECTGSVWYRLASGRWVPSHLLHCPANVKISTVEFSCPTPDWPEEFGPIVFCTPQEFDIERGQCLAATTVFRGLTPKLYASWTPSAPYVGAEFHKQWTLDGAQFLTSASRNLFGYLEVATRESLKPGAYNVDLFVDDERVQTGAFLIAE